MALSRVVRELIALHNRAMLWTKTIDLAEFFQSMAGHDAREVSSRGERS
jgi:hypothetical protein